MQLKLDLSGIILKLRIYEYHSSIKEKWESQWCKTDFSFYSEKWLDYSKKNDEVFLSLEIEELVNNLEMLLDDKLKKTKEFVCMEPDFKFILHPKKDLRKDSRYVYIAKGYEIQDISMDWITTFWHEGLTENHLSVSFIREDIQCFLNYLKLIIGRIQKDSPEISDMIAKGMLCD